MTKPSTLAVTAIGRLQTMAIVAAMALGCCVIGFVGIYQPFLLALPAAVAGTFGILSSPRVRLLTVVFGGIVVLQSSAGLDVSKLTYLAACALSVGAALVHILANPIPSSISRHFRPLIFLSVAWGLLLVVSILVATSNGISITSWIRDSVAYLLIAITPIMALDAATTQSRRWLVWLLVSSGTITSISYLVAWVSRRGYADLPIDRLFLYSNFLPAALFAVACASLIASFSWRWLLLATLVPVCFLLTGSRTSLLFSVVPFTIVLLGKGKGLHRLGRGLKAVVPAIAVGGVIAWGGATLTGVDLSQATDRFTTVSQIFSSSAQGQSFVERQTQTRLALDIIRASPLLGTGPGHVFHWQTFTGMSKSGTTIDSPLSIVADYGLIGVALLLWTGTALWSFAKRNGGSTLLAPALLGFVAFLWLMSFVVSSIEDKGLSLSLMILLPLVVLTAAESERPHEARSVVSGDQAVL